MNLIEIGSLVCIFIGLFLLWYSSKQGKQNHNIPAKRNYISPRYCILIPARNESKVIEELLVSIKAQSYPIAPNDVYVIVESEMDPTVTIVKKYNMNYFVRNHLELQRKGYALDEMIKELIRIKKQYDAYFIMDADNVLDSRFIEEMDKTYQAGYDIGMGYRNCKNGNDTVIASCTTLTFTMLNDNGNQKRNKDTRNITLSGTGMYIAGEWIKKWKGFPFHSLTEDYELTLYSILHNMTSYYNKKAVFYDEQPTSYHQSVIQRIRWVRGYFDSRKYFIPKIKKQVKKKNKNYGSQMTEIIGVKPYIWMVVGVIMFLLYQLFLVITSYGKDQPLYELSVMRITIIVFLVYFILAFVTFVLIWQERKRLHLSHKMKLFTIFWNPFFLFSYVPCAVKAVLKKEVEWKQVEHSKSFFTEK